MTSQTSVHTLGRLDLTSPVFKELAESLAPTFEKAKSAFIKAYEEFTKEI